MGNRCATQYGVTTIQGARVAVIAVQDTRRALAARLQAEVPRRARIAIVAGFGVTLEHTSVLGRATVRRAGVPVIANKERVRCLTEASETFFSYGAKATIVAWDLEMNNDTPYIGTAVFRCAGVVIVARDFHLPCPANTILTGVSHRTYISIITGGCVR